MAFLDLNAPPTFATRRAGVVLRIHEDWLTAAPPAEAPRTGANLWRPPAVAAIAAAVHFWAADALGSQLLGVAATGVLAAIAISLVSGFRR